MSTGFGSSDANENDTFCSVKWDDAWANYNDYVHHPLLLSICILGCLTNALNLFIFTRTAMQNPTNFFLSVLAVTDFLCVFRKATDLSLKYLREGVDERTGYHTVVEDCINQIFFYLFHTWSIYMTVAVALWRLLGVLRPLQSRYWLSYHNAKLVSAIFVGFATLLVPMLFIGASIQLYQSSMNTSDLGTVPLPDEYIDDPDYELYQTDFGQNLHFWIHGLLVKLIPCFTLILSTIVLVTSLRLTAKGRLALFADRNLTTATTNRPKNNYTTDDNDIRDFTEHTMLRDTSYPSTVTGHKKDKAKMAPSSAEKEFTNTTKMLIILLILFLVTELPPGILGFSFGLNNSKEFFRQCYLPVRGFLNLNEYISSSVGFFIYMKMSSKFRKTFVRIFWNRNRISDENLKPSVISVDIS